MAAPLPAPPLPLPLTDTIPLAMHEQAMNGDRTPTPPGGFPIIHHQDARELVEGMPRQWLQRTASAPPDTLMLVRVWNYRFTTDFAVNRQIASDLEIAIRRALNVLPTQTIYVIPPEQDPDDPQARPLIFTIHGLMPLQVQEGVGTRVYYSFNDITFFTFPTQLTFGSWLFALEHLVHGDREEIYRTVRRVLDSDPIRSQITRLVSANPRFAGMPVETPVWYVLNTLEIRVLQMNNGNYIANAYMMSPTTDLTLWRGLVTDLRSRRYESPTNTTAIARHVTWCAGCRGTDHPTHLCPFQDVPGWNAPPAGSGAYSRRRMMNQAGPSNHGEGPRNLRDERQNQRGGRGGRRGGRGGGRGFFQ